jgi:retron-type reverse transcriptase
MIPKKDNNKTNPKNLRPIPLRSCIARLCERFVLLNINKHLKDNNLIVKQQSGFRAHRQTKDNIFAICQKNLECFNQKKKNCVIFFDISRAFDNISHNGLISKLVLFKIDNNIIKWILNFITNRFFKIKINHTFSSEYSIETGVSQGGVLSPTLFSIYVIDIIFEKTNKKTPIISSLFADDLSSSC